MTDVRKNSRRGRNGLFRGADNRKEELDRQIRVEGLEKRIDLARVFLAALCEVGFAELVLRGREPGIQLDGARDRFERLAELPQLAVGASVRGSDDVGLRPAA